MLGAVSHWRARPVPRQGMFSREDQSDAGSAGSEAVVRVAFVVKGREVESPDLAAGGHDNSSLMTN
eukprot:1194663-Prorocentrum_minimum.AAC.4